MADLDDDDLLDALGVEAAPSKASTHTAQQERLIAGFEDILHFVEANGRAPQHGEDRDIFERIYAVRLDRLRGIPDARDLLANLDTAGLLQGAGAAIPVNLDALDDEALLAELGAEAPADENDISRLRHVASYADRKAAEEIANRTRCQDFELFRPKFEEVEIGLKTGKWITKPFAKDASIELGDFFIIGGQIAYVAKIMDGGKTKDGRDNPRLRVIFDNQTESDLLLRSLSRSLYPDGDTPVGRRIIKVDAGPLFGDTMEPDDIESGTIYVLQSQSDHPYVVEHRELIHKIGVTGMKVETRIAGAKDDATYLLAGVTIVATYKLAHINRTKLENLFHKIFGPAQLDLTIEDRFGKPVKPREWFFVPLEAIDDAVNRIRDGSITKYVYDPKSARLVPAKG
ncbi:GIY-YIG nuclease family protein [Thermomonas aquatica]|uniref:GIY-YIG nuclease family protein n=1 Tax=Thermomonas aquatica TaxID=2202149 RepID=A0A5B7ZLN4_9GAMM|nr:GIY-YIG nuclease family protein [Thermomonas aquatica]QDA56011.1 GIY-YIG nuclease family protein [Thermomonas aquatica]